MAEIGKLNKLKVNRDSDYGVFMDGENLGEILLPNRYVPVSCEPGDEMEVFIYHDSEDRLTATTEIPYAMDGEFAFLEVVAVNRVGAFVNWGLPKDLLVPFKEQNDRLQEGNSYLFYVYLDEKSERMVASARIGRFLSEEKAEYVENQEVNIMVWQQTDLGYKVIVEDKYAGMLYKSETFERLKKGQNYKAYIKKVRPDNKIDLSLAPMGKERYDEYSQIIMDKLKEQGGFIALNDKSPAEKVYSLFKMSKKNFKKSLGALYKQRLITFEDDGIKLV
jgi:predicted RNA-binding protein (virulence factor B family)